MTIIRSSARVILAAGLVASMSLPGFCGCAHRTAYRPKTASQCSYFPRTCACNPRNRECCGDAGCYCVRSGQKEPKEALVARIADDRDQPLTVIVYAPQTVVEDVTTFGTVSFIASSTKYDQSLVLQRTRLNC
jgi:hypothetical protein